MRTELVHFDDVEVGDRLRPVDPAHVTRLATSIAEIGLQTPITFLSKRDGLDTRLIVVAGRHRLAAMQSLGIDAAPSFIIDEDDDLAALWEIDENLARAELTDAQRADHHTRREAILIRRGEVSKGRGGDQTAKSAVRSYSAKAADDLGISARTVRQDLRRGKNISPAVLAEVAGSDLDKGVVLDQLASTPMSEQPAKLAQIRQERSNPVRPAADPLDDPDAHEKQVAGLMAAWNRAAKVAREEFLLRIDRPVFDSSRAA